MGNLVDIPTYIENPSQDNYEEELNQTLQQLLDPAGWVLPNITTVQSAILEPSMAIGSVFFDTNLAKLRVKTAAGVLETIQSV